MFFGNVEATWFPPGKGHPRKVVKSRKNSPKMALNHFSLFASFRNKTRWWFQIFFMFIPIWGNDPIWRIFFNWVETTNQFQVLRIYTKLPQNYSPLGVEAVIFSWPWVHEPWGSSLMNIGFSRLFCVGLRTEGSIPCTPPKNESLIGIPIMWY